MIAKLNYAECLVVAHIGIIRRISALFNHRHNRHGEPQEDMEWALDIEGAAAEYVVARYLDRAWGSSMIDASAAADVSAMVQVRRTRHPNGMLLTKDSDRDDQIFVLVRGRMPVLDMAGWAWGRDAKNREKTDPEGRGRSGFFMPASELRPMPELKQVLVRDL